MGVAWKDFFLMYVIGFLLFILFNFFIAGIAATISFDIMGFSILPHLLFILLYCIPLGFYFWRNNTHFKKAGFISFVFGFSLVPIIMSIFFVLSYVLISLAPKGGSLTSGIDWTAFFAEIIANGLSVLILGLGLWFVLKELRGEKEFQEIKQDLTEDYQNFLNSFGKDKNK